MTVAASYLDRSFPTTVKLGDGQIFKGASIYRGKGINNLPLVYDKTAAAAYCMSGSLDSKLVKGKIVVCQRGLNNRAEKGEQIKLCGGAGMLLVNTQDQGEELFADAHILPATSLGAFAGIAIKNMSILSKVQWLRSYFKGLNGNPAPVMAVFSSRGASAVGPDVIMPDITAPGVNILASWSPEVSPTRLGSDKRRVLFNIVSATSMSCPHILKSAHKD